MGGRPQDGAWCAGCVLGSALGSSTHGKERKAKEEEFQEMGQNHKRHYYKSQGENFRMKGVFLFSVAAVTNYHRLSGFNNRKLLFFLKIFLMWTIFEVFIEFISVLLLFYVLVF